MYDITQCDIHSVGLSMVFVNRESKLYITHGLELNGWTYTLAGLCIIIVVACVTQNIVHLAQNGVGGKLFPTPAMLPPVRKSF